MCESLWALAQNRFSAKKKFLSSDTYTIFWESFHFLLTCICFRKVTPSKQRANQHPTGRVSNQSVSAIFPVWRQRVFPWLLKKYTCPMSNDVRVVKKEQIKVTVNPDWNILWQEAPRSYLNTVNRGKTKLSEARSFFTGQWIDIIYILAYTSRLSKIMHEHLRESFLFFELGHFVISWLIFRTKITGLFCSIIG